MTTWITVHTEMPPPGGLYLVFRKKTDHLFHATVCYGIHAPWWIPRNGFTLEESPPIQMLVADLWQLSRPPP
jgi:hypothetical protein